MTSENQNSTAMNMIWMKFPAWLRAIFISILLLFPTSISVQLIIQKSISSATWGWGLFSVILVLIGYWFSTKWIYPFKGNQVVRHSMSFEINKKSVRHFFGIFLLILCLGQIFIGLVPADSNRSLRAILAFRALPTDLAIPHLLAMALMAAIVEEVTYRGFVQNTMKNYPKWLSFILVGVLFTTVHRLPWQLFIPYLLMSISFSIVADQQKTLGIVIWAHLFSDFIIFMGVYFDLLKFNQISPLVFITSIIGTGIGTYLILKDFSLVNVNKRKGKSRVNSRPFL